MSIFPKRDEKRKMRWYFGGAGACCATVFTHPLDLLKVLLQTQSEGKSNLYGSIKLVYRDNGIGGFYSGLSASLLRQVTLTTARFGFYEIGKDLLKAETFAQKAFTATAAGIFSGIIGVPMDMVNVRMQNDMKLPLEQRRNYKHVGDGLISTYRESGFRSLFSGGTFAVLRGCLMTIGANVVYDEIKPVLQRKLDLSDGVGLHMSTSLFAAVIAAFLTQPLDVLKTRLMNAKPGQFKGNWDVVQKTAKEGPLAFYKGILPAFLRLGPHTILTFMFMEQFRLYFGSLPQKS